MGSGDEDEAAYVDSFFLPGGILDPEEEEHADKPGPSVDGNNNDGGNKTSFFLPPSTAATVLPPTVTNLWDTAPLTTSSNAAGSLAVEQTTRADDTSSTTLLGSGFHVGGIHGTNSMTAGPTLATAPGPRGTGDPLATSFIPPPGFETMAPPSSPGILAPPNMSPATVSLPTSPAVVTTPPRESGSAPGSPILVPNLGAFKTTEGMPRNTSAKSKSSKTIPAPFVPEKKGAVRGGDRGRKTSKETSVSSSPTAQGSSSKKSYARVVAEAKLAAQKRAAATVTASSQHSQHSSSNHSTSSNTTSLFTKQGRSHSNSSVRHQSTNENADNTRENQDKVNATSLDSRSNEQRSPSGDEWKMSSESHDASLSRSKLASQDRVSSTGGRRMERNEPSRKDSADESSETTRPKVSSAKRRSQQSQRGKGDREKEETKAGTTDDKQRVDSDDQSTIIRAPDRSSSNASTETASSSEAGFGEVAAQLVGGGIVYFHDVFLPVIQSLFRLSEIFVPFLQRSFDTFANVAKIIILAALGLSNILKYAMEEMEQNEDGAFFCYLVLYLIPNLTDFLMSTVSMPHYTPHLLSTLSLYILCNGHPGFVGGIVAGGTGNGMGGGGGRRRSNYGGKQRGSNNSNSSTHGFNQSISLQHSDKVADDICSAILLVFRRLLPVYFIFEGFSEPNLSVMTYNVLTRLLLAYVLSLIRANLLLSPVAWLSWAIQYLVTVYVPSSIFVESTLLLFGLASVRLSRKVQKDVSTLLTEEEASSSTTSTAASSSSFHVEGTGIGSN